MNSHFSHLDRSSMSNTTSIKRSYEQFGLDHDSSLDGSLSPTSISGSSRSKRARSEGRSSTEMENSSSSSSNSSRSPQTSSSADDPSMDHTNDSQSSTSSLDPSNSSTTSSIDSSFAFPTDSSRSSPVNIPLPAVPLQNDDSDILVPQSFSSMWRQSSDDQSFESVMNRASDFERNIAVLRDLSPTPPSPPSQLSPSTIPFVSLLDCPLIPDSPPLSRVQSQPGYISWSSRIPQEQQRSRPSHHSSYSHENLQSINPDLPNLRQSLSRSSPRSFSYSRETSSRGLRPSQSRLGSEFGFPSEEHWSQDRDILPESLPQRSFERDHLAMATSTRHSDLSGYPGGNLRRDPFAADRGHLPTFSRNIDEFRSDVDRLSPDFNNSIDNGWPQEDQWSPSMWTRPRDPLHETPIPADGPRSSWFTTRPAPSNTLMSESAEHRRRRFQRQMLASLRAENDEDIALATRTRSERLVEVDRPSRSVLIEDMNDPHPRSRVYDHRTGDTLHLHPTRTTYNTYLHRLPPPNGAFHPGSTIHIRLGDNPTNVDDSEILRQRRRERLVSAEAFRASPHIPPVVSARILSTHRSPSPAASSHRMFDPPGALPSRGTPNSIRPATDRPSFSAIFSPPWSDHSIPDRPPSRHQTPPDNDNSPLHSSPEEALPPTSSIYRDIDLNAYQHGPFRASLERFRQIDRVRDSLRSRRDRELSHERERGTVPDPSHGPLPRRERNAVDYTSFTLPPLDLTDSNRPIDDVVRRNWITTSISIRPPSPPQGPRRPTLSEAARQASQLRRRPTSESIASPRRPPLDHAGQNMFSFVEAEHRDRREIHALFTRRPRLEASRIDADVPTSHLHPPSVPDSQTQGLNQTLDLLRADGLSSQRQRQLFNRFHRERNQDNRRSAALWGEIESRENNSTQRRPLSYRRASLRRDVPPFDFGASGTTSTTNLSPRGTGSGRMSTGRRRSPSHSPTRGSGEPGPNVRSARGSMPRRSGRRFMGDFEGYLRFDYPHPNVPASRGNTLRLRNWGDYMRDEDFDDSFESLTSLTASLGEVKPKYTPEHVIWSLPSGTYKDWATPGCDQRCPICLDDYQSTDQVLKISDCSHWLHKDCLEQWLHSANTCPVCRKQVKGKRRSGHCASESLENSSTGPLRAGPSRTMRTEVNHDEDNHDDEDDEDGDQNNRTSGMNTTTSSRAGSGLSLFF